MNVSYSVNNWYLVVCILLVLPFHVLAQDGNKTTYDFEVQNKPLFEVLDKLSDLTSVHFTYNSNEPAFGQRITYKASKKTFDNILNDILNLSGQKSKKIGNQWVIFANADAREATQAVVEVPNPQTIVPLQDTIAQNSIKTNILPASKPDTLIIRDTLILKESVIHTDTLVIRDTVTVIKEVRHNRKPGFRNFPKDFFQFDPNRSDGLFLGLSYGQYYGGVQNKSTAGYEDILKLSNDSESLSLRNYSLGADIGYSLKKWAFSFGLELKGFSNRFKYNQVLSSGGYFRQDTVSWYYNIVELDTTWFAITDSTYLPFEKTEVNYNQLNRMGLLDLQLGVAYTWYAYANTRLYVKGRVGYSMMIYQDGILIQNKPDFPGMNFSEANLARNRMTYQLGAGVNFMAGNTFDLFAEIGYQGYSKSLIADYPIDKRLFSVGFKMGIVFFL
jgi:hypothetical protein